MISPPQSAFNIQKQAPAAPVVNKLVTQEIMAVNSEAQGLLLTEMADCDVDPRGRVAGNKLSTLVCSHHHAIIGRVPHHCDFDSCCFTLQPSTNHLPF
jgi:hypothetical protein